MTTRIGGIWKRDRPQKRWTYQNEENLNKKLPFSDQRPEGMKEDCTGSQVHNRL
jgi:hypothetical protein